VAGGGTTSAELTAVNIKADSNIVKAVTRFM
jgi:hypothetical protein